MLFPCYCHLKCYTLLLHCYVTCHLIDICHATCTHATMPVACRMTMTITNLPHAMCPSCPGQLIRCALSMKVCSWSMPRQAGMNLEPHSTNPTAIYLTEGSLAAVVSHVISPVCTLLVIEAMPALPAIIPLPLPTPIHTTPCHRLSSSPLFSPVMMLAVRCLCKNTLFPYCNWMYNACLKGFDSFKLNSVSNFKVLQNYQKEAENAE